MLQINLPSSEIEFVSMMEIVDSFLKEADVPIPARPIRGWFEISKALKLGLRMTSKADGLPREGVYFGDDLSVRIFSWFDERYGNKLAIRMGPGRGVVAIRGDFWEVQFPMVYGQVNFFISAVNKSSNQEDDLRQRKVPHCNILDEITNLPNGLAKSLTANELRSIADSFIAAYQSMEAIHLIKKLPMVSEILSDIDTAVHHLLSNPPHYGLSKWSSLQVVEKFFKSFLTLKNVSFPHSHNLEKLSQLTEAHGLFPVEKHIIKKIQCSAGVRYGDENVKNGEAYEAYLLSVLLGGRIAQVLYGLTRSAS